MMFEPCATSFIYSTVVLCTNSIYTINHISFEKIRYYTIKTYTRLATKRRTCEMTIDRCAELWLHELMRFLHNRNPTLRIRHMVFIQNYFINPKRGSCFPWFGGAAAKTQSVSPQPENHCPCYREQSYFTLITLFTLYHPSDNLGSIVCRIFLSVELATISALCGIEPASKEAAPLPSSCSSGIPFTYSLQTQPSLAGTNESPPRRWTNESWRWCETNVSRLDEIRIHTTDDVNDEEAHWRNTLDPMFPARVNRIRARRFQSEFQNECLDSRHFSALK